jgi:hypothetical protein
MTRKLLEESVRLSNHEVNVLFFNDDTNYFSFQKWGNLFSRSGPGDVVLARPSKTIPESLDRVKAREEYKKMKFGAVVLNLSFPEAFHTVESTGHKSAFATGVVLRAFAHIDKHLVLLSYHCRNEEHIDSNLLVHSDEAYWLSRNEEPRKIK